MIRLFYDTYWSGEPLSSEDPEIVEHWNGLIQWLGTDLLPENKAWRKFKLEMMGKRWLKAEENAHGRTETRDDFRSSFFEMVNELVDADGRIDLAAFVVIYECIVIRPYEAEFVNKFLPLPDGRTISWLAAKHRERLKSENMWDVFEIEALRIFKDLSSQSGNSNGLPQKLVESWGRNVITEAAIVLSDAK